MISYPPAFFGPAIANTLLAGPVSGAAAAPALRTLVAADLNAALRVATPATALNGLLSLGAGPFDGVTVGFFVGSAQGTHLAINGAVGFLGDPVRVQVGGVDLLRLQYEGTATFAGNIINTVGDLQLSAAAARLIVGGTTGTGVVAQADAANIWAQRNGISAQTWRLYRTWANSGTDYERFHIRWAGSDVVLETGAGGTGVTTRAMFIGPAGAGDLTFQSGSSRWKIAATTGYFTAVSNLNLWIGTSALATTATAGFLGVNSCAGMPTGVPAAIPTGQVPVAFDTTNGRFCFYYGAAWHYVAQTA